MKRAMPPSGWRISTGTRRPLPGSPRVPAFASLLKLGVLASVGGAAVVFMGYGAPTLFAVTAAANVAFAVTLIGSGMRLMRG